MNRWQGSSEVSFYHDPGDRAVFPLDISSWSTYFELLIWKFPVDDVPTRTGPVDTCLGWPADFAAQMRIEDMAAVKDSVAVGA